MATQDKIDMSLDDIIRLNRSANRKKIQAPKPNETAKTYSVKGKGKQQQQQNKFRQFRTPLNRGKKQFQRQQLQEYVKKQQYVKTQQQYVNTQQQYVKTQQQYVNTQQQFVKTQQYNVRTQQYKPRKQQYQQNQQQQQYQNKKVFKQGGQQQAYVNNGYAARQNFRKKIKQLAQTGQITQTQPLRRPRMKVHMTAKILQANVKRAMIRQKVQMAKRGLQMSNAKRNNYNNQRNNNNNQRNNNNNNINNNNQRKGRRQWARSKNNRQAQSTITISIPNEGVPVPNRKANQLAVLQQRRQRINRNNYRNNPLQNTVIMQPVRQRQQIQYVNPRPQNVPQVKNPTGRQVFF